MSNTWRTDAPTEPGWTLPRNRPGVTVIKGWLGPLEKPEPPKAEDAKED